MPPELFVSGKRSKQSDLYSLGVLLYHLVTGTYPVEAGSMKELRAAHKSKSAKLLRDERSDLPENFLQAVEKALDWDPTERFQTAGQMEKALVERDGDEPKPVPWGWIASAAGAVAAGLILAVVFIPDIFNNGEESTGAIQNKQVLQDRGGDAPGTRIPEGQVAGNTTDNPSSPIQQLVDPGPAVPEPQPIAKPVPPPPPPLPTWEVEAALYRSHGTNKKERMVTGARIRKGDAMFMEFKASTPVYVYILNVDEAGEAWFLFPMPGISVLTNPLQPNKKYRLPGVRPANIERGGRDNLWLTTSSNGKEQFLIMASPERQKDIEAELSQVPRPQLDPQGGYVKASPKTVLKFRGMGGIKVSEAPPTSTGGSEIFEQIKGLADKAEQTSGVWVRQIDLENPPTD